MVIRFMNTLLIIALSFTISCNQSTSKEKTSLNMVESEQGIQSKIDSIVVKYWKSTEANEYVFYYSDEALQIKSKYFGINKSIGDKHIKQKFLNFVNGLYIEENTIVLSKKVEPAPVSDYPIIEAVGFLGNRKIFKEETILYSNIEFNPKFLEFYEFLDSLVKDK